MRDESYTPFRRQPPAARPREPVVFVLARVRGDLTDSMRGSLRPGPHGWESIYMLTNELYQSHWYASEALARADLATQQDVLAAAGWTPVPF